jgi:hypothetical protein
MGATKKAPSHFNTVPDHFAPTMFAYRSHRMDRTLKAVERVPHSSGFNGESFIIFITTGFALCHRHS